MSLHMSKCHIVGSHMPWLNYVIGQICLAYHEYNISKREIIWASTRENLSSVVCKQLWRILISVFVICSLQSIISRLATSDISIIKLVSVAEQADLNHTLSET